MAKVRFEPIGEEIECGADETVLDAAFRQGLNLVYGCREGQCSACKCFLTEGEVALKRYSNFALSDSEQSSGYSLMCRAMPEQDLVIELLHFDPDNYRLEHAIRDGEAVVDAVEPLTHDITRLVLSAPGFTFTPGQYVDLHVPGDPGEAGAPAKRSFSMANLPSESSPQIELMIKRYPGGRFSGLLEAGSVAIGDTIAYTGPYGSLRARESEHPVLMVAGGSGMAPILSLLRELARQRCARPIRFFYGARTEEDLFHHDEIARLGEQLSDFVFTPVTERFVHEVVDEFLAAPEDGFLAPDVYMCGPPPMVEAAETVLIDTHKLDEQRIYIDKFTVSADAPTGETSRVSGDAAAAPPVKRFESGPAAHAEDDVHRSFGWYTPRKRRASLYEDVTIDTQPSVLRHMTRGWPVRFEDGRGTWNENSTRLRSTDWYDFRDPGEQWERPFYQAGTATEQQIDAAMRSAIEEGLLHDFHPEWVTFLRGFLQIPAYYEHGLWFAMATIARDCLSDSVATVVALQASMKQRAAQSIVLYAMDLEEHHGEFPIEAARRAFIEDAEWQPTRRFLERLAATHDWGEVIVAANLCLEPIVGTLIRRELGTRAAAANGDTITPVLARVETQEWEWARAWTIELMRFLLDDSSHGEHNRATISAWIADWLPQALEAALALIPVAQRIPSGIDIEQALERLRTYAAHVLRDAGVPELTSLIGFELPVAASAEPAVAAASAPAPVPTRRVRTGAPQRSRRQPTGIAPGGSSTDPSRAIPETKSEGEPPIESAPADSTETYDFVGIVMAKSAEGDAVAEILGRRDDIEVIEQPAFWDIRAKHRLEIPYTEVSEQLGYEIDAYSIQHEMSTHYGRLVATDDALMLFSDPTEAMQYLMS